MSATDSDNSIDWLASDNEDNESKQEPDCSRKHSETEPSQFPSAAPHLGPSDSSCCRNSEVKKGVSNFSKIREARSQGSPPSCTETWDRDSSFGLYKTQQGENAKNTQQALKRHHSSTEEEFKERQLISTMSEKDRFFSSKVSTSVTHISFPQDGGFGGQQK